MYSHLATSHYLGIKLFKCPFCIHKAKDRKLLRKHLINEHIKRKKRFNCQYCEFWTKFWRLYLEHQKTEHSDVSDYILSILTTKQLKK